MAFGDGNWYTRYGQIKQWVLAEDGEAMFPKPEKESE